MRIPAKLIPILMIAAAAGCGSDTVTVCCQNGQASLRVVNAFTGPVNVYIDGNLAIGSLAAGTIGTAAPTSGGHTLVLRPTGSGASSSQSITTSDGVLGTIAAVRSSSGAVSSVSLDDTGSVVPNGATKVRVIHFAPNAGTLQVYRTQPDYQTPISWQFPFTYQAEPTSLSAPFFQSTVGSWEIRIWQTPADASGWANAPVKVVIPLTSGQKKTVVILDQAGGGVRVELL